MFVHKQMFGVGFLYATVDVKLSVCVYRISVDWICLQQRLFCGFLCVREGYSGV
jgi:hypothetical protein